MKIVRLDEIEGMTFPAGRTTKVLTGTNRLPAGHFTAGMVFISPDGRVPLHSHSNEEIYIIVKGRGRIRVGSEEQMVEAVSAIYIEPHAEHFLHNTGKEEMLMIFVYAPAGVVDHWFQEMTGGLP